MQQLCPIVIYVGFVRVEKLLFAYSKQCDLGKRVSLKKKRYMAALNVSSLEMVICG